jgi:DNA repair protein RadA/Sms
METVKGKDCACFLVGHVTKDGALAGPKVLEHMVDTVLSFEGDHTHAYRILRSVKNRFGASGEIGVFEMNEAGLHEVTNPSAYFISERHEEASGSAVTALMEGTRPILTEIQALVSGPVPGQGRRTAIGFDHGRLALLIAVIEKKLGFALGDHDVFLNAVGGMRVREPAADLAAMAALLSSILDRPTPAGALVLGEVGLTGEVRRISHVAARCNEAARIGFRRLIAPKNSLEGLKQSDMETLPVSNISELIPTLFGL